MELFAYEASRPAKHSSMLEMCTIFSDQLAP